MEEVDVIFPSLFIRAAGQHFIDGHIARGIKDGSTEKVEHFIVACNMGVDGVVRNGFGLCPMVFEEDDDDGPGGIMKGSADSKITECEKELNQLRLALSKIKSDRLKLKTRDVGAHATLEAVDTTGNRASLEHVSSTAKRGSVKMGVKS